MGLKMEEGRLITYAKKMCTPHNWPIYITKFWCIDGSNAKGVLPPKNVDAY